MAKRIYVGNLPYSVDSQQLAEVFGEYGQVEEAVVVTDRDSGQSKGFGFVQMAVDAEALNARSSPPTCPLHPCRARRGRGGGAAVQIG